MRAPNKRLIKRCSEIAEAVADRNGFVPIRKLLEYCGCEIVVRPLLVEAAVTTKLGNSDQWIVLLNNEIHKFSDSDFELESSIHPLASRTRNTVAHEVAHKVAFDLLGMDLEMNGSLDAKLAAVERVIESISPLLLLPKKHILRKFNSIDSSDGSFKIFADAPKEMGISREVFLSAVKIISQHNRSEFLGAEKLSGALWGLLEYCGKDKFKTRADWTFRNFHTGPSHEASNGIQKKGTMLWIIESIQQGESTICTAISESFAKGRVKVAFEIEAGRAKARNKTFFKLAAANSYTQKSRAVIF